MIELYRTVAVFILALFAMIWDLRTYRIPNRLLLVFLLLIPPFFVICHGHYVNLLGGLLVPFVLLFPVYKIRGIGAGDVKEMCIIGCFLGLDYVLYFLGITLLFGGIIGGLKIIKLYKDGNYDVRRGTRFHFAVAIFLGAVTTLLWMEVRMWL